MAWNFVGRAAILERLREVVSGQSGGLAVITGEPGVGRSAIVTQALAFADPARDLTLRLRPVGDRPYNALRASLLPGLQATATNTEVLTAISENTAGARLVVAVDDAHLIDHASLLAVRELSRGGRAVILASTPLAAEGPNRPDPSDCLRYEEDAQVLVLPPLSVGEVAAILAGAVGEPVSPIAAEALHAATGGNPRRLHDLVTRSSLIQHMEVRDGQARLAGDPGAEFPFLEADRARVIDAAWAAWRGLARERAEQLCLAALCCGVVAEIAPIWSTLLLLRGDVRECLAFLDELPSEPFRVTPTLYLVKALALTFGAGRAAAGLEFLAEARTGNGAPPGVAAYRAWLLAATGQHAQASTELSGIDQTGAETAMFVHTTRATLTGAAGSHDRAVFHLRRALAAEGGTSTCPWMRSLLVASLIDAMFLSGRVGEASSLAGRFHALTDGSGWDIALAFEKLTTAGNAWLTPPDQ